MTSPNEDASSCTDFLCLCSVRPCSLVSLIENQDLVKRMRSPSSDGPHKQMVRGGASRRDEPRKVER